MSKPYKVYIESRSLRELIISPKINGLTDNQASKAYSLAHTKLYFAIGQNTLDFLAHSIRAKQTNIWKPGSVWRFM